MGIDYDKLRAAAGALQSRMDRGSLGPSVKFWKPKDGKNTVRIMPPWSEEAPYSGQFFREVFQHWGLQEGAGPLLCTEKTPHQTGECAVCQAVEKLRAKKSDVKAQEMASRIRAKVAYLFSIVDLTDAEYTAKDVAEWAKSRPDTDCPFQAGDPKIQCYAAGPLVANDIMNIIIANELDITNLTEGNNVIITRIPNKNPRLTKYTVTPEIKKTKSSVSPGLELPDLSKIGRAKPYEEVRAMLAESEVASFGVLPSAQHVELEAQNPEWENDDDEEDMDLGEEMRSRIA